MLSEHCKKKVPGAVGAILSASNKSGKGEGEEPTVEDGVIVKLRD